MVLRNNLKVLFFQKQLKRNCLWEIKINFWRMQNILKGMLILEYSKGKQVIIKFQEEIDVFSQKNVQIILLHKTVIMNQEQTFDTESRKFWMKIEEEKKNIKSLSSMETTQSDLASKNSSKNQSNHDEEQFNISLLRTIQSQTQNLEELKRNFQNSKYVYYAKPKRINWEKEREKDDFCLQKSLVLRENNREHFRDLKQILPSIKSFAQLEKWEIIQTEYYESEKKYKTSSSDKKLQNSSDQKIDFNNLNWRKISSIFKNPDFIHEKITPLEVKQGALADCYFLASVAALAEIPERIEKLFSLVQKNSHNYLVKILLRGVIKLIKVNDKVPIHNKRPLFGFSKSKVQLWLALLEKAWAELYGGYQNVQDGLPIEGLHDLTGAPIQFIDFLEPQKIKISLIQQIWKKLVKYTGKQYAMVICTRSKFTQGKEIINGLLSKHAYTLIGVHELILEKQEHRLVCLRNPHANDAEWKGDWHDGDPRWEKVSEQIKYKINYLNDPNDGIFFMPYNKFVETCSRITVAKIDDNASYTSACCRDPLIEGIYFSVQINTQGNYSFQLNKTPKRWLRMKNVPKWEQYNYPTGKIILKKIENNEEIKDIFKTENQKNRTIFKEQKLFPGKYLAYAKIDFDKKYQTDFQVNLGIYGSNYCKVQLAVKKQVSVFCQKIVDFYKIKKPEVEQEKCERVLSVPCVKEKEKMEEKKEKEKKKEKKLKKIKTTLKVREQEIEIYGGKETRRVKKTETQEWAKQGIDGKIKKRIKKWQKITEQKYEGMKLLEKNVRNIETFEQQEQKKQEEIFKKRNPSEEIYDEDTEAFIKRIQSTKEFKEKDQIIQEDYQ